MPKITEAKISLIKDLYIIENKSLAEIARQTGVSRPSVRKILRKEKIRNVTKKDCDFSSSINFTLFDKINDEKSAYFFRFNVS